MELMNEKMILTRQDHQTHQVISVRLPHNICDFSISFDYTPESDDSERTKKLVIEELMECGYLVNQGIMEHWYPVRNLITLSISLNEAYIGAHHCKDLKQVLLFKPMQSPLGFSNVNDLSGLLNLSFDCHAIVSETVCLNVRVEGTCA